MPFHLKTRQEAVRLLCDGSVGVMPTDTMYGLVAKASDKHAVERMYSLKNRIRKPGTVIAASVQQLIEFGVPEEHLMKVAPWWPAPLSVETPLNGRLSYLHQNTGRQAFRVVNDPDLRAVLAITGPLVTSSANAPGLPSAVDCADAINYFHDDVDFYVDMDGFVSGPPSTIIQIIDGQIHIVRHGAFTFDKHSTDENL